MIRGETSIEALGQTWPLRFGFRMIVAVEQRTGANYMQFVRSLFPQVRPEDIGNPEKMADAAAAMRLSNIGIALGAALAAGGNDLDEGQVADIIDAIGIGAASAAVGPGIIAAISGEGGAEAGENPPKPKRAGRSTS